jgi:GT2 family glycosyltransferase
LDSEVNYTIGIPTIGRSEILLETLRLIIGYQVLIPDDIIICATKPADVAGIHDLFPKVKIIFSEAGACKQRNAIIKAAVDADVLVFFDDDFIPDSMYLASMDFVFVTLPSIVVATGRVLADGITSSGISHEDAIKIIRKNYLNSVPREVKIVFSGYGCNMALRMSAVRENNILFDERLPMYSWQEDVDFSRRMAKFGAIGQINTAVGVHLGVKSGRTSGVRFGYSQVANPLYLFGKKQGYTLKWALFHICKNFAMNVLKSFKPEPYVDRFGRLRGNIKALFDLMRGKMTPERVLELK